MINDPKNEHTMFWVGGRVLKCDEISSSHFSRLIISSKLTTGKINEKTELGCVSMHTKSAKMADFVESNTIQLILWLCVEIYFINTANPSD